MEVLTLDKVSFSYNGAFAMTDISLESRREILPASSAPTGRADIAQACWHSGPTRAGCCWRGSRCASWSAGKWPGGWRWYPVACRRVLPLPWRKWSAWAACPYLGRWSSNGSGDARAVDGPWP